MRSRLTIIVLLLSFISSPSWGASSAEGSCYEKGIIYPNGMFGKWGDKRTKSSHEISRIFQFGKDTLSQRPSDMLYGLAYLEVMVNELCKDRHDPAAIKSQRKIQNIVSDLRQSLGLSKSMSRQKMVNIYWSTGKLLSLAKVKKIKIDIERKQNINSVRKIKSILKTSINKKLNENIN